MLSVLRVNTCLSNTLDGRGDEVDLNTELGKSQTTSPLMLVTHVNFAQSFQVPGTRCESSAGNREIGQD